MKIKNVEKWENELVKALKCNYFVEGLKATGTKKVCLFKLEAIV